MQDVPGVRKAGGFGDGFSHSLYTLLRRIGAYFVNGIIIIIPLAVTIWVVVWVFNLVDGMLSPILEWGFGRPMPGLGTGIIVTGVIGIGYFGLKVGHRKAFDFFETQFIKIPVIGAIYGGTRQIMRSFTGNSGASYKFLEAVFIEYPRKGIYTLGFVTSEAKSEDGKKILNVFVPTAPTPAGGFIEILPEADVIRSTMSLNDAMKLIITMGKVSHRDVADIFKQAPDSQSKDGTLELPPG
jgi:uncharacterized membrane protein